MTATPETTTAVQKRLEEIRAREAAATPGHWGVGHDGQGTYTIEAQPRLIPGVGNVREGVVATLHGDHDDAQPYRDSGFIARAREDVPFLLDRVAELEALVKDPQTERDAIHKHFGLSYANYLVIPRTLLQSMPDEWQTKFVALLKVMEEAFAHVPQVEVYQVEAATEHEVSSLTDEQLKQAGITADWYRGQPVPEDLSPFDLAEWRAEHEDSEGPTYSRDGEELDGSDLVLLPAADPVPHYNRGRTRIEPRLGGAQ